MDSKQLAAIAKNQAMSFVAKFDECAEQGICLYLWSKARGSGKSRLASTIANELTSKGIRNKFVGASALLDEIQSSWDDKETSTHKIIKNYIEPKILIIDDLGERGNKEWINNNLFLIIDKRYQDKKPTVFTSNYDIMNLPLDTRMTDRLTETCLNIELPNESIRQNQKSKVSDMFNKIVRGESDENS
jgi:DNA replication protein DnaC